MKRFVTSDSHGGYKALVQCLERCAFDREQDQLYFVGDVVDGWSETKESVALLLSVRHLVFLLGNHDQWALQHYTGKLAGREQVKYAWLRQGGAATVASYGEAIPVGHLKLLQQAKLYHVSEDNILFVHAGFDPTQPLEETDEMTLLWNRDFLETHYRKFAQHQDSIIQGFKDIYIGHTPTYLLDKQQTAPLQMGNVTLIDTGAAFMGRLSILDIDSKEVWQSDPVMELYPDEKGRNGISWNDLNKRMQS